MHFLSLTPVVLLQLTFLAVLHGAKWTYSGPEGEHHWPKNYPYCGGTFQSPIDIKSDLLRFDPTLRPIEIHNYNLLPHEQLTLGNNGHSVQISLPSKMYISSLPHRYTAAQLHFHWGSSNRPAGSEHTVNSKQYAAEMHVVHYNSDRYPNMSMAVDKSDGLAVLGVLIEVGEFNPAFEQFLKFINGIKYRDQRVQVPGFNIRALLPTRLDEYYRYDGSLTTPPCYPSVLWTVFRNHVTISRQQFLALSTALYSSHAQDSAPVPLNGNFRKPQHPDSRVVLVSFKDADLSWINTDLVLNGTKTKVLDITSGKETSTAQEYSPSFCPSHFNKTMRPLSYCITLSVFVSYMGQLWKHERFKSITSYSLHAGLGFLGSTPFFSSHSLDPHCCVVAGRTW